MGNHTWPYWTDNPYLALPLPVETLPYQIPGGRPLLSLEKAIHPPTNDSVNDSLFFFQPRLDPHERSGEKKSPDDSGLVAG